MAIYHLSVGFVSRSTGRSSVQSAAYITGQNLYESRRDLHADYQNRHHAIASTATLAPDDAPDHFRNVRIWDTFESFEDTYAEKRFPHDLTAREKYLTSAQTAMTIVTALPHELSMEVSKELVEHFAQERFVARGLIVTYALHNDEGNPHAHLQISRRAVNEKGEIAWAKDRGICTRRELLVTRKLWADLTNDYLEREGFETRITEKSFADLGIHLEPTQHRGWYTDKLQEQGLVSRIVADNEAIFEKNREQIQIHPETILNEITSKQATFTQRHLLKAIHTRVGDDAAVVAQVFEEALHHAISVGEGIDGQVRYTSATLTFWLYRWERYQAAEEKFLSLNAIMHEGVLKQLDWYRDLKRFESSKLTEATVMIVDEAGMIGTRLWHDLLNPELKSSRWGMIINLKPLNPEIFFENSKSKLNPKAT